MTHISIVQISHNNRPITNYFRLSYLKDTPPLLHVKRNIDH